MPVVVGTVMPAVRVLLNALREVRERSGMTSRDLSLHLGFSHSVVSHWETGRSIPTPEDIAGALTVLGVVGAERATILGLARAAAAPIGAELMPGLPPQLADTIEYERSAVAIDDWAPAIVPGLVQVSAYTRALYTAQGCDAHEVEARVLVQSGRRDILTRHTAPVEYVALISEAALREPIGSPQVMAEQLYDLLALAALPYVTIQVMPLSCGWHLGLLGQFGLYHFPNSPDVVRHEHVGSACFLDDRDTECAAAVDAMMRQACSIPKSLRTIRDIAQAWEKASKRVRLT